MKGEKWALRQIIDGSVKIKLTLKSQLKNVLQKFLHSGKCICSGDCTSFHVSIENLLRIYIVIVIVARMSAKFPRVHCSGDDLSLTLSHSLTDKYIVKLLA